LETKQTGVIASVGEAVRPTWTVIVALDQYYYIRARKNLKIHLRFSTTFAEKFRIVVLLKGWDGFTSMKMELPTAKEV
jgi:hypothetical protein